MNKYDILYNNLIGYPVIIRATGSAIHLSLRCEIVRHPLKNEPYTISELTKGMKNINGRRFSLCPECADLWLSVKS